VTVATVMVVVTVLDSSSVLVRIIASTKMIACHANVNALSKVLFTYTTDAGSETADSR